MKQLAIEIDLRPLEVIHLSLKRKYKMQITPEYLFITRAMLHNAAGGLMFTAKSLSRFPGNGIFLGQSCIIPAVLIFYHSQNHAASIGGDCYPTGAPLVGVTLTPRYFFSRCMIIYPHACRSGGLFISLTILKKAHISERHDVLVETD